MKLLLTGDISGTKTRIAAFLDKGRMRPLLEAMPVKVILNNRAALYGPALLAAQRREAA